MPLSSKYSKGRPEMQAQGAAKCVKLYYLTNDSIAKEAQCTMK
jgi:hypothetical protein